MLKLEDIGFLEVIDSRASNIAPGKVSYCEWIITPRCNFKCPYCNMFSGELSKEISTHRVYEILDILNNMNVKYIHLTGGEPTVRKDLLDIVSNINKKNIRVGISSNGSQSIDYYNKLIDNGVELFSFSLDIHKSELNKKFTAIDNIFDKVVTNIKSTANRVYVNVGVVFNDDNISYYKEILEFISGLGVTDIRIMTATKFNQIIKFDVPQYLLDKHQILKFRIENYNSGKNIRGSSLANTTKCHLVRDDITLVGEYLFPCAVYAREGGNSFGIFDSLNEVKRLAFFNNHNSHKDEICKKFCMDFKCRFNDKVEELSLKDSK
jgi:molybdenum cofactor biosynthesis enzyme MoaA